jgi:hypothetical protein
MFRLYIVTLTSVSNYVGSKAWTSRQAAGNGRRRCVNMARCSLVDISPSDIVIFDRGHLPRNNIIISHWCCINSICNSCLF